VPPGTVGEVTAPADSRTVALTVPPRADYLVFARLALSAVCRLTPLEPDDVVDLKLAVTEAASAVAGDERSEAEPTDRLGFSFHVEDDRLVIEVRGAVRPLVAANELELGRAIIDATVDECDDSGGVMRLVKYLNGSGG
jgi:anti-sigma regulatory factor (Ser/Thr protein kinase)